jgi:hypothetical protein
MKTKIFFFSVLMGFSSLKAQNENLPSIAVANPNVNALSIKPESGSKMMRLELIKMNKYKVYDEFDMADVLKAKEVYRTLEGISSRYPIRHRFERGTNAYHLLSWS